MNPSKLTWLLTGLLILLLGATAFLSYRSIAQTKTHALEKLAYESTIETLNADIAALEQSLAESRESNDALSVELQTERSKNGEFERTINGIKSTVSTLEKLQYTDPELLAKYSKVYFLSDTYVPSDLAQIPSALTTTGDRTLEVHARVLPYLTEMFAAAAKDGIDLRVASAYRSFGTQAALKSNYAVTYGSGANRFSADQGYSEHQLGTTLDISTKELGASFTAIDSTPSFAWLTENAHRFGFVLSYPKGNTYYQYEPWHWRFVGKRLARDLHEDQKYLYELTQRELDEYLVYLFD